MAYEDMPTGKPIGPIKINDPLVFFLYQFDSCFSFIHCTVYSPVDMSIIPPLFFRSIHGRIIYPLGSFSGTYFSEELKKAKEVGFIIIPHSYIKFHRNKEQFKDFIEETYQNRISHKKNTP